MREHSLSTAQFIVGLGMKRGCVEFYIKRLVIIIADGLLVPGADTQNLEVLRPSDCKYKIHEPEYGLFLVKDLISVTYLLGRENTCPQ